VNEISKTLWAFDNIRLWSVIIGGLICLWVLMGKAGWKKLNSAAVILLFLLTLLLSAVVFKNGKVFTTVAAGGISFGSAVELSVIMPLSWLPLIGDYTRYAERKRDGAVGSYLGYFIGSSWMYTIGLAAAISTGNSDPGTMLLAAGFGFTALGIVVLSTVTTTFLDAYSAGVSFLNLLPRLKERHIALAMGIAGTLIALAAPIEEYENFLYAIGSVFAPLFAVVLTDYFLIMKDRKQREGLLINWGAVLVWAAGVIMYYQFIKLDFLLGATVPVMILTSAAYLIMWRFTRKWKLLKKHQSY